MRVVLVAEVYLPKIDGVVHRTLNLIRELSRAGDVVLVVCADADGCDGGPAPVVACPSFSFPLYPEYRIGRPNDALVAAVRRFRPDVLHFINPFAFGFRCYGRLVRGGVTAPTVFSFHTLYGEFVKGYRALKPLSKLLWWMTREYHNLADVNLTVSGIMRDQLEERGFRNVRVWPPSVDSGLFHPAHRDPAMRARLSRGRPDRPLLLTVSRLAPEKNVAFLAALLARLPGTSLAIVGDGPQRAELVQQFAGRDANFVGYLQGRQLAAAYASSDAFVYASETETMGNVVLEAMASGLPVVAPRAGGIPDLVMHNTTGYLYAPGDLADAIGGTKRALNRQCGNAWGAAARAQVCDWGWGAAVSRVRAAYHEAMELAADGLRRTATPPVADALVSSLVTCFRVPSMLAALARKAVSTGIVHGRFDRASSASAAMKPNDGHDDPATIRRKCSSALARRPL